MKKLLVFIVGIIIHTILFYVTYTFIFKEFFFGYILIAPFINIYYFNLADKYFVNLFTEGSSKMESHILYMFIVLFITVMVDLFLIFAIAGGLL